MVDSVKSHYKATVVVTSDTCSVNPSLDTSGEYVVKQLEFFGFSKVNKTIVADDKDLITKTVKITVEDPNNVLTITVGGTGLCPRDVTPEATSILYERDCNGISNALYMTSLRYSVHAALSRLTAGISNGCLIVNFPGKLKACKECFSCLSGFLSHALEQIEFDSDAVKLTHRLQDIILTKAPAQNDVTRASSETAKDVILSLISPASSPTVKADATPALDQETLLTYSSPLVPDIISPNPPNNTSQAEELQSHDDSITRLFKPLRSSLTTILNVESTKEVKQVKVLSPKQASNKPLPSKDKPVCSPYPQLDYGFVLELLRTLSQEVHLEDTTMILDSCGSLQAAIGNILKNDLYSKNNVPPFPVSIMDGYALHIPDGMLNKISSIKTMQAKLVGGLSEFETLQDDPKSSKEFFCYQINTGGKVPKRNYAIIPFEKTLPKTNNNTIPILKIELGKYVRAVGSDLNPNDSLKAGTRIGPVEMALIQSMGHRMLNIVKKPTIGVLSTGDELVDYLNVLESFNNEKVIDTNGPLIASLLELKGYTVNRFGIAKDEPEDILLKIVTSLRKCDVLVITGGASMGVCDHVKSVIEKIGGVIHFGKVNIKPGKPAALASVEVDAQRKFIFSLPGNPVSAYITTILLVIPFIENTIRSHLGIDQPITLESVGELITVEVGSIVDSEEKVYIFDGRLEFLRAKLVRDDVDRIRSIPLVNVSFKQQSSRILNLKDCDCLLIRDPSLKGSKFLVGQIYPALRVNH